MLRGIVQIRMPIPGRDFPCLASDEEAGGDQSDAQYEEKYGQSADYFHHHLACKTRSSLVSAADYPAQTLCPVPAQAASYPMGKNSHASQGVLRLDS